jgi:hypothetical protein
LFAFLSGMFGDGGLGWLMGVLGWGGTSLYAFTSLDSHARLDSRVTYNSRVTYDSRARI